MIFKNRTIANLNISTFFSNMFFDRALWIIYLIERGISTAQIGFLESLLHLSILFFEIPTGIVADIYGRRISLIFARIFVILYSIGMLLAKKFSIFSIVFIILGMSETFVSGADTALIYDSIKSDNDKEKEKKYIKFSSIYGSFTTAGLTVGMFLGGLLKLLSWKYVYIAIIIVEIISIIPLLTIKEKKYLKEIGAHESLTKKVQRFIQLKRGAEEVLKNSTFLILTFGIVMSTATINAFYIFAPLWFKDIGFKELFISSFFAVDSIVNTIMYAIVYRIEKWVGINKLIIILPLTAGICLIILPFISKYIALIIFLVINNTSILFYPLSNTLINKRISSEYRSTILSTVSFINSIIIMLLSLSTGYFIKFTNVVIVFASYSFFLIISIILLDKFNKETILRTESNLGCGQ
jgi:MFS family permease